MLLGQLDAPYGSEGADLKGRLALEVVPNDELRVVLANTSFSTGDHPPARLVCGKLWLPASADEADVVSFAHHLHKAYAGIEICRCVLIITIGSVSATSALASYLSSFAKYMFLHGKLSVISCQNTSDG